ncbi:putative transporter SEO1 [Colletotrichum asianum]
MFSEAGYRYRGDELMHRAGIFYVSSGVGTMTTGLLASRVYQSLDGALGLPGWRWMYIVASIMTFPIAAWGAITFPGTPKDGKRWYFTDEEFALAKQKMIFEGRFDPEGLSLSWLSVKRFLGRWHFWVLVPWNVMWLMGYESMVTGSPTLWLRSNEQYSVAQVNNFTAISPSIGILFILGFSWTIDKGGQKAIAPLIGAVSLLHFISKFAWIVYDQTSFGFKWFAVAISYIEVSLSPINYSLANLACAGDAEERAFVVSSMLAIRTAFGTWVPIVAFPTVEAPRFFRGYIMEAVMQVTYFSWTCFVVWYSARDRRRQQNAEGPTSDSST